MTNQELLEDLKQFVDSRISQSEINTDQKLEKLEKRSEVLEKKLDQMQKDMISGFAAVGTPIVSINDQLENHETRIKSLEKQPA